eukprot:1439027-Rhodomonas_salina.2
MPCTLQAKRKGRRKSVFWPFRSIPRSLHPESDDDGRTETSEQDPRTALKDLRRSRATSVTQRGRWRNMERGGEGVQIVSTPDVRTRTRRPEAH